MIYNVIGIHVYANGTYELTLNNTLWKRYLILQCNFVIYTCRVCHNILFVYFFLDDATDKSDHWWGR
jgi:hypothetical protein